MTEIESHYLLASLVENTQMHQAYFYGLYMRKRVIRHWNTLPGEVVTAASLTEFRKHLDGSLKHNLIFV